MSYLLVVFFISRLFWWDSGKECDCPKVAPEEKTIQKVWEKIPEKSVAIEEQNISLLITLSILSVCSATASFFAIVSLFGGVISFMVDPPLGHSLTIEGITEHSIEFAQAYGHAIASPQSVAVSPLLAPFFWFGMLFTYLYFIAFVVSVLGQLSLFLDL